MYFDLGQLLFCTNGHAFLLWFIAFCYHFLHLCLASKLRAHEKYGSIFKINKYLKVQVLYSSDHIHPNFKYIAFSTSQLITPINYPTFIFFLMTTRSITQIWQLRIVKQIVSSEILFQLLFMATSQPSQPIQFAIGYRFEGAVVLASYPQLNVLCPMNRVGSPLN